MPLPFCHYLRLHLLQRPQAPVLSVASGCDETLCHQDRPGVSYLQESDVHVHAYKFACLFILTFLLSVCFIHSNYQNFRREREENALCTYVGICISNANQKRWRKVIKPSPRSSKHGPDNGNEGIVHGLRLVSPWLRAIRAKSLFFPSSLPFVPNRTQPDTGHSLLRASD